MRVHRANHATALLPRSTSRGRESRAIAANPSVLDLRNWVGAAVAQGDSDRTRVPIDIVTTRADIAPIRVKDGTVLVEGVAEGADKRAAGNALQRSACKSHRAV